MCTNLFLLYFPGLRRNGSWTFVMRSGQHEPTEVVFLFIAAEEVWLVFVAQLE